MTSSVQQVSPLFRLRRSSARLFRTKPEAVLSPLLLIVLITVWHYSVKIFAIPSFILPPPGAVLHALISGFSRPFGDPAGLWYHTFITAGEALLGFALGSSAGFIVGTTVAHSRIVERVLYPYVLALQSLPKIAVAPLFVIWFGFGMTPKVVIAAIVTFFPLLVNSIAGCRSVDVDRIDLARSIGASKWQIFTKITLPSSMPYVFAGLHMAAVLSVIGAIVGEFVGAQDGLGVLILQNNFNLNIAATYAIFVILSGFGACLYLITRSLERKFCFWAHRKDELSGL